MKNRAQEGDATDRLLIEISTAKRKAIYCPYCGKRTIEPTNIILC